LTNPTQDISLRHQRREQGLMLALASPALLVILTLVVLPVGWLGWQSIYHDGFTLENYRRIWSEDIYWRSFLLTFEISLLVTLLALLLGYPIAYAATIVSKGWRVFILALVILPFWTSVLVRAYAWLALLQRTGVLNQLLEYIGVIDEPLALVHNSFGTVVATVHILLPFMVLPLYGTMQKIPNELMQAGASLGGSPSHIFWRVFLPLSLPGVLAGQPDGGNVPVGKVERHILIGNLGIGETLPITKGYFTPSRGYNYRLLQRALLGNNSGSFVCTL